MIVNLVLIRAIRLWFSFIRKKALATRGNDKTHPNDKTEASPAALLNICSVNGSFIPKRIRVVNKRSIIVISAAVPNQILSGICFDVL